MPFALTLPTFSPWLHGPLLVGAALLLLLLVAGKLPLSYSLRNLLVRWRTTTLTALAFMLVVGLLVVMLAFVSSMRQLTEQSGQPGNVIVLSDGATDELFSNLGFAETGDIAHQPGILKDEAGRVLCSRETYLVVNQPTQTKVDGRPVRRFVQLRGIEDPVVAGGVHGLALYPGGQWFSQAGVERVERPDGRQAEAIQAVIGEGIARELGRDRGSETLKVGDVFDLGDRSWIVVGILQSEGSTFGSEVWAKWDLITRLFGKDRFTSIVLRTADDGSARDMAKHLTTSFKKAALQALPETEYFSRLNDTAKQFLVAIVFVTVIMSIGGVFGVMNTMFAAVSARKRDIGVLRIVGFARWQVLAVFLAESLMVAVLGGALGCAIAMFADGWTANSILQGGAGGGKSVALRLAIEGNTLAAGMVVALLMGGIGGFLPALSAMRQRPLDALR